MLSAFCLVKRFWAADEGGAIDGTMEDYEWNGLSEPQNVISCSVFGQVNGNQEGSFNPRKCG